MMPLPIALADEAQDEALGLLQDRVPLWLVKDRWQRDIVLYEDTWFDHILPNHEELRHHEAAVAKVLERPYRVMDDVTDERRECFYAQIRPDFPHVFVKVCVEFFSDREGLVVSAFLTSSIRTDEGQRWP
jgi:hypothetical protein